jgi:predicted RNase H-like HicB family nuclease
MDAKTARFVRSIPYRIEVSMYDETTWLATIPTLGQDLFRGAGDTEDEAVAVLASIYGELLQWLRDTNRPIPEPTADDLERRESTALPS